MPQFAQSQQSQYLATRVQTASQPELQLMLLDGALRFGQKARQAWRDSAGWTETERHLSRLINIVEALVHGLSEGTEEVSKRLEEQYAFIFREIAAARINNDINKFDQAMRLLAYERETWKMAVDKLAAEKQANDPSETAAHSMPDVPMPHIAAPQAASATGISFQA